MGELRAYFFNNMYLSGIHAGIQAQHCTAEMFIKYRPDIQSGCIGNKSDMLYRWAEKYKTTIILNGGYNSNLQRLEHFFADGSPFPWASFYESEEALATACTSVGIVLPERIFNLPKIHDFSSEFTSAEEHWETIKIDFEESYSLFDVELAMELQKCRLMN